MGLSELWALAVRVNHVFSGQLTIQPEMSTIVKLKTGKAPLLPGLT